MDEKALERAYETLGRPDHAGDRLTVRAAITAYLQALSPGSTGETEDVEDLRFVFDRFPCPDGARFIEVEDRDGFSVNAGEWRMRDDGLVELVVSAVRKDRT